MANLTSEALKALARRISKRDDARYSGTFKTIATVTSRAFVKHAQKVAEIDDTKVKGLAATLEAACVMMEETPLDTMTTLTVTHGELAHFVAYMRTMDYICRKACATEDDLRRRVDSAMQEMRELRMRYAAPSPFEQPKGPPKVTHENVFKPSRRGGPSRDWF